MMFPKRLSRRAVMKSASVAPLMLLGNCAWADPTRPNMDAVRAQTRTLTTSDLAVVLQKADDAGCNDLDKFELVVRALWRHFEVGRGPVELSTDWDLLDYGFDYKSGAKVVEAVNNGKFDPFGDHQVTNICAYICGHKAATKAIAADAADPKITKALYRAGWDDTEKEMKQKLALLQSSPGLGFGC